MVSNCPACGAPLNLDGKTTQTTCPFCGNAFQVDNESVQPGLSPAASAKPKPQPNAIDLESLDSAMSGASQSSYEPPSAEPPQIDTDPLYNPPIGTPSSSYQSPYSSTSSPRPTQSSSFPRQTYDTARQTAQNMYGTIAAKGKNFLIMAVIGMLALTAGCCVCLVLAIQRLTGG